ncbi:hypothetical protein H5410_004874 [Solanum commersonii]|uniref:Uncharacterized protein n=1 Tax=Solanum commersonii TaxID=4109 RepID=A0A9J6A5K6_SOLCO|nr:hypothetical protein H5410_004874 [Solanum commersonii]
MVAAYKAGHRTGLYRYRSGTIPVCSGPVVFGTERDTVSRYTGGTVSLFDTGVPVPVYPGLFRFRSGPVQF